MMAWASGEEEEPHEITPWHFGRAAHLAETYLLPMARRAYADAACSKGERAGRRLVALLQENDLRQFTAREILRMERSGIATVEELNPGLGALEEADIIRLVTGPIGPTRLPATALYRQPRYPSEDVMTRWLNAACCTAATLPVDGSWRQTSEFFAPGSFFSDAWDFTCASACTLDVSDWAVISYLFEVFNNAVSIGLDVSRSRAGTPSAVPPLATGCHVSDPDVAWADARFSKASFALGAGDHSITIRNLFIPPQSDGGEPFPDSTVQLRVSPVPGPRIPWPSRSGSHRIWTFKETAQARLTSCCGQKALEPIRGFSAMDRSLV